MNPSKPVSIPYSAPGDRSGQITVDLARTLAILIGVGGLPLLSQQVRWFWWISVAGGLVAIAAGVFYIIRQVRRKLPPWWLLPLLSIAIGVLIILAATLAHNLEKGSAEFAGWIEMYFASPALLLWAAGEGIYFYPHFAARPHHIPQVTGMLKSLLQIASAIFIWVYLGLSIGMQAGAWLLWVAAVFGLAGAYFGVLSETVDLRLASAEP